MTFCIKYTCVVLLCLLPTLPVSAQDSLTEGIRLFQDGQLVKARQFFETLHTQQPTNRNVTFYIGRIAFEEKKYEHAIEWLKQSIDEAPCNADQALWLGRAYGYHAQQVNIFRKPFLAKKVQEHFEKAVACDPSHVAARWDLMEYYLRAPGFLGGSTEKAKEQATRIRQFDPDEGQKAWELVSELQR